MHAHSKTHTQHLNSTKEQCVSIPRLTLSSLVSLSKDPLASFLGGVVHASTCTVNPSNALLHSCSFNE